MSLNSLKTTWRNSFNFQLLYSGIAKSGELITLQTPSDVKDVKTFAYVSSIPYIKNFLGFNVKKETQHLGNFSYTCNLLQGKEYVTQRLKKNYVGTEDYWRPNTIVSGSGAGFKFYATCSWGGLTFQYRYQKEDGTMSEWIKIFDIMAPMEDSVVDIGKIKIVYLDIPHIDKNVLIEFRNVILKQHYRGPWCDIYDIELYGFKPTLYDGEKCTFHWFAFADVGGE